jgi:hypothetical protein
MRASVTGRSAEDVAEPAEPNAVSAASGAASHGPTHRLRTMPRRSADHRDGVRRRFCDRRATRACVASRCAERFAAVTGSGAACTGNPSVAAARPFWVQSVAEIVHRMHFAGCIVHIFGGLAFHEGHNIAKCAIRRA